MGIPDSYILPKNYNEAYHIAGDGLAVPAVAWIERQILSPLMESIKQNSQLGKKSTFETGELAYA
jgi:DNA (cytosine-5)-methyltransferase 1